MEFELNTFDVWLYIGIIVVVFLIANVLRRKVGFIRKSLIPTAVIGGLLILILKSFGLFNLFIDVDKMNEFMEAITYHALGFRCNSFNVKRQ